MKYFIFGIQENTNQIRLDKTPLYNLTDNIQRYGLIHPVVVNESGEIICGSRRY